MVTVDEAWSRIQPVLQEVRAAGDVPWEQRRARFLELLGVYDPGQDEAASPLFHALDELPDGDRAELLAGDRLEGWVLDTLRSHLPETGGHDETAWQAYLAENGPRWDGTEDSWPAFREWFAYYAADQGLTAPATALLGRLDTQAAPDRVATFAALGVVVELSEEPEGEFGWVTDDQVTVLAGAWGGDWHGSLSADLDERWGDGWQAHPAEHKAAWLGELVASGAFTGDGASGDAQLAELAEVIRQVPGYDQLSPEELAAAIAAAAE